MSGEVLDGLVPPKARTAAPSEVRAWLRKRGENVGNRGHLPEAGVKAFNRYHRQKKYENRNPWKGHA